MSAARPSQPVIRNALEAAKAAGFGIAALEITRDGTLRIVVSGPDGDLASPNQLDGNDECDRAFGIAAE